MSDTPPHDRWTGILTTLPAGTRVMITAFLAILGFGYLIALMNIRFSHQMADGTAGLSFDDVRAVYSGLPSSGTDAVASRMLTMIRTEMRQYVESDDDFHVLEDWLESGATEAALDEGPRRMTPRRVLIRNCLRCHARSTESAISRKASFGEDELDVDREMMAPVLPSSSSDAAQGQQAVPQYGMARLILVSHVHMLAIPVFALIVAMLFMTTRSPPRLRAIVTPLPMLALIMDFGGWWLARISDAFCYAIMGAGAVFGLAFGIQLLVIVVDLWRPAKAARR